MLIGEKPFMDYLQHQQSLHTLHDAESMAGLRLLWRMLFCLREGIKMQNAWILSRVTDFVEALLQGHFCHWKDPGGLSVGFDILRRMAPAVFSHFEVDYVKHSKCTQHRDSNQLRCTSSRLEFRNPVSWDDGSGELCSVGERMMLCDVPLRARNLRGGGRGVRRLCLKQCRDRIYHILTPQDSCFFMVFERGIPESLMEQILSGQMIYFGPDNEDRRNVGQSIFEMAPNCYAAAYLMHNTNSKAKRVVRHWWIFDLQAQKYVRLTKPQAADVRVLFIQPPTKCVGCEDFNTWQSIQCPQCKYWLHPKCVEPVCLGCTVKAAEDCPTDSHSTDP